MASIATYIGLDVGAKRIGVARGNDLAKLATPLTILKVDGTEIESIKDIASRQNAEAIVIGLPRGLDGQETQQTATIKHFAKQLESLNLALHWQDEAGTSRQATDETRGKTKHVDDKAAAIFLQDFLDNLP